MRVYTLKHFLLMVLLLSSVSVNSITFSEWFFLATAFSLLAEGTPITPASKEDRVIYIDGTETSGASGDTESSGADGTFPLMQNRVNNLYASIKSPLGGLPAGKRKKKGGIYITKEDLSELNSQVSDLEQQSGYAFEMWGYYKNLTSSYKSELKRVGKESDHNYQLYSDEYNRAIKFQRRLDRKKQLLHSLKNGKKHTKDYRNNHQSKGLKGQRGVQIKGKGVR